MKILEINAVPYGSTCRIMLGIRSVAPEDIFIDTACGYSTHPLKELPDNHYLIGSVPEKLFHTYASKLTGYNGVFSFFSTLRLIKKIEKENYDLIHLHNIHGWYLNLPVFMDFLKKKNIPIIWTLHDCWSFTGKCTHYAAIGCDKWKTGCYKCPQLQQYPKAFLDKSETMYRKKQKWFLGIDKLTIVTPSAWLKSQVKESFLKEYPAAVVNNGIDLSVFKPAHSVFRTKYNLQDKYIVLGVSLGWDNRKGIDAFIQLAHKLDDRFQVILIGGDKRNDEKLPPNIISIHRTQNQKELAEIYSAADVFVNPTQEDTFPTVDLEALACGTPIVAYDICGVKETFDKTCGILVENKNIEHMILAIKTICTEKPISRENCINYAKRFNMHEKFKEYISIYRCQYLAKEGGE